MMLFWDDMQQRLVVIYQLLGQPIQSICFGQADQGKITIKILITFYIYFPVHFSSTNNIYV